ncbi:MAG TPA: LacI family DNA-binding transcriptional regulator [Arachnia sp.]|nr:LacI family DNA-binding transcriptional regulator [Arachnia sp.]HMT85088.1 LacI family DNA-binding transcriptional regulator [Arachnia sp.]
MPGTDGSRIPTMVDVAKAAGVSRALVSIVMRGAPGASEQTRAHVLAAAAELGYVPDARAQALRQRGKPSIGVVFQPSQPFQAAIVDRIYAATRDTDYSVVLSATTESHGEGAALESLMAYRCGSLIALGTDLRAERLAPIVARLPLIVVAWSLDAEGVECVASDDSEGMAQAIGHLVALGHRRIAYLESPSAGGNAERRRGYLEAMAAHGLTDEIDVVPAGSREQGGAAAAEALLERPRLPTAIISFNDNCAAGVQDIFVRRGVRIPEDVSLVGFDDSEIAQVSYRQLTTIRQDIDALAQAATRRAIDRMFGRPVEERIQVIPTTLTLRATTAPPRRP